MDDRHKMQISAYLETIWPGTGSLVQETVGCVPSVNFLRKVLMSFKTR